MITKERIKEFEDFIKKCIIFRFQKFLPETSIIMIQNNNYADEKIFKNNKDLDVIQSNIIRNIIKSIINLTIESDMNIGNNEIKKVIYGEDLENGFVELYSKIIADAYNIKFINDEQLTENLNDALKIEDILYSEIDNLVFNSNALEILRKTKIEELINKYDNLAIERHIEKQKELTNLTPRSIEEENDMKKEFYKNGNIKLMYLNGKKIVQYIDEHDKTHLIKIPNDYAFSDIYRKSFSKDGNIDSKKIFEELKSKYGEIYLTNELDKKTITPEKIDTLESIESNPEINSDNVLFNEDAKIYVLENNEVVEAIKEENHIEAKVTEDMEDGLNEDAINSKKDISEQVLTERSIEEIYSQAENSTLTLEELRKLKRALIQEAKKNDNNELADSITEKLDYEDLKALNSVLQENDGPKLSMNSKNKKYSSAAFINASILLFILSMITTLALLISFAFMLLYK